VWRKEMDDNAQLATLSVSHLPGVDVEGIPALGLPETKLTPIYSNIRCLKMLTIFSRICRFVSTLADPPAQLRRLAQKV